MKKNAIVIALPGRRIVVSRQLQLAADRLAKKGLRITGRFIAGRMELVQAERAL